jgi:hypothetical protein
MRALVSIAACLAIGGIASAQWSDDFNRPDGPIGGAWTVVSGSWAIISNQGTHTTAPAHEYLLHNVATAPYDQAVIELDVFAPGSGSQFSAVLIGLGGTDTIQVKIQDQVAGTPGFSNVGIYHMTSPSTWGAWTGTGTGFGTLSAPFLSGRMKVYFPDPNTLVLEVDTDFNGTPDQTYTKDNVLSIAPNLGTGLGIMCWGSTALFDNWTAQGGGAPPVVNYCTAGTSTNGCNATMSATNQPSLTQAAPCVLTITNVEGQKSGIVFYGLSPASGSWCTIGGTSLLCVKAPTQRTITATSGGTIGACDGSIALDWDAYQLANPSALGNPWLAGAKVYAQGWYRDPPACKTTNMSDAVELTYVP